MSRIIIIALIGLVCFLFIQNCKHRDKIVSQDEAIAMYQKDEQFFISELDSLGRHIATQEVIILQYDDKVQILLQENSGLKKKVKILSQEKLNLSIKLDSLTIPVDSSTLIVSDDCKNGYSFGTEFKLSTEFFSIKVKLHPFGITIPSLYLPIDVVVTHYTDNTIGVFSKNPYVEINNISSVVVEPQKKKKISKFWLGYGLGVISVTGIAVGGYYIFK